MKTKTLSVILRLLWAFFFISGPPLAAWAFGSLPPRRIVWLGLVTLSAYLGGLFAPMWADLIVPLILRPRHRRRPSAQPRSAVQGSVRIRIDRQL